VGRLGVKNVEFLACLILVVALAGCAAGPGWASEDSWYEPPPEGSLRGPGEVLERARIHEVLDSKEADAEALLEKVAILELKDAQATAFTGEPLPQVPGTRAYLVRGVYLSEGTGSFSATVYDGQLVVFHGSLGSGGYTMKRQALVIQLEQPPDEVFVTCSMAK
jgi:hypothetical protein